jgi:hypothetical protein
MENGVFFMKQRVDSPTSSQTQSSSILPAREVAPVLTQSLRLFNAGRSIFDSVVMFTRAVHPDSSVLETRQYDPYPASIAGLSPELRVGLHAMGVLAAISAILCLSIVSLITFRMVWGNDRYGRPLAHNQNILLIVNLLLADIFQSVSFLISFRWLLIDGITAPTMGCSAQGLLLNFGDISSGLFVLLIAIHSAWSVVWGRAAPRGFLIGLICSAWALAAIVTALGPAINGRHFYTSAGAWVCTNLDRISSSIVSLRKRVLGISTVPNSSPMVPLRLDLFLRVRNVGDIFRDSRLPAQTHWIEPANVRFLGQLSPR